MIGSMDVEDSIPISNCSSAAIRTWWDAAKKLFGSISALRGTILDSTIPSDQSVTCNRRVQVAQCSAHGTACRVQDHVKDGRIEFNIHSTPSHHLASVGMGIIAKSDIQRQSCLVENVGDRDDSSSCGKTTTDGSSSRCCGA